MLKYLETSREVVLEEESLRDGLQNERRILSLDEKLELVHLLATAGIRRVQVGSFVNPRTVPQMADTDALVGLVRAALPHLLCTALVLNRQGLDRAIGCGLDHISLSLSVSDSHSRKNVRRSATEALEAIVALVSVAVAHGITVRAGVQSAFGCADDGCVPEDRVLEAVRRLAAAGAAEINLADTAGKAHPDQVRQLVARVRLLEPAVRLSLHLHDTRGLGLANLMAGYEAGVRLFDVAAGGLGGCPFVQGAAGNVATEEAVHLFQGLGVDTGIDLGQLHKIVERYQEVLGRPLPEKKHRM
jgi:hydroxymethylglutaryl-CoA lyase